MRASFSLLELVITIAIISTLAVGGMISYSSFINKGNDTRRRYDLEEIKAALEMYRSNDPNSNYPRATNINTLKLTLSPYIRSFPVDPETRTNYVYPFISPSCPGGPTPPGCRTFIIQGTLDNGTIYQVDPLGSAVVSPTPIP